MSRRAAVITQADVARAIRAAKQAGAEAVQIFRDGSRFAYGGFCRWREAHCVRSIAHEVTLVSEKHQLGGTPDCVAFVDGEIGLLDFKTCSKVPKEPYQEQLMAMAAHATLWNEHYPDRAIRSCHLIYLPKDGSAHRHHAYADVARQWREFAHLLAAFAAKNGTPKPVDARDAEIARLRADIERAAAPKRRTSRKRVIAPKPSLSEPAPAPVIMALPPPLASPAPIVNSQASPHPGEAEFVGRTIAALIIKGEIAASQIAKTTARLREIWRETDPPDTTG